MSSFLTQSLIKNPDQAIKLLQAEKKVMEMIAVGEPLPETLKTIALNYEENSEGGICSILLMNDDGIHVKHGAGPSLPDDFNNGINGEPIGPVAGSCGTAAYKKERVIVSDIANDPLWVKYRDFALQFGLKACWSTPILSRTDEVLGTFAIYYGECKSPDGEDLELIDRATSQVKIALEHNHKEHQLRKSEEKLKQSLNRITDGFVTIDSDWRISFMNERCGKLLQRDPAKVVGNKVFDEFPELYNQPWHEAAKSAMKKQKYVYLEDYIEVIDRWFEDHFYPSEEGVSIYFRDVTRKKRFEKERINKELQFSKLTSNAPVAIFQTDNFGQCTYVNPTWLSYSGMQYEEAMGFGWNNAIHPDDRSRVLEEWQTAVSADKDFKSEFRFRHKNGNILWLDAKAVALSDSEKNIYGHIGMASDISERKKVGEIIEESEKRYRTTMQRITDGFVALDRHWRYTYMNQAAAKIFNRDPEKIIGKHIWTEFPEGIGQPFHGAYMHAMLEQEYTYLEEYYPPYDKWFENHIYPSPEGLSVYFTDISDRKKAEGEIVKAKENLERAEAQAMFGNWEINLVDNKRTWSKQLFRLLGFALSSEPPPKELIIEHIHPEDRQEFKSRLEKLISTGETKVEPFRTNPILMDMKYLLPTYRIEEDNAGNPTKIYGTVQDVTEIHLANQLVKINEEKYRTLIEQAADAIFLVDLEGNYLEANESASVLTGYSIEELKKMNGKDLVEEANLAKTPLKTEEIKRGEVVFANRVLKRKDKSLIRVEIRAKLMSNGQANVIIRDVTERFNNQEKLQATNQRLQLAEKMAKLGNWEYDLTSNIGLWSNQMFRFYGLEKSEYPPDTSVYLSRIHPEDRLMVQNAFIQLTDGEGPEEIVYRTNPEVTDLKYLSPSWQIIKDQKGKPLKIIGTVQDVTERILSEQQLKESEEKYRTLIEKASDAIIIADGSLNILEVNAKASTLSGFSKEELLGKTIKELVVLQSGEVPFRLNELLEGKSILQERFVRRKDGEIIPVELSATITPNGYFLGFVRDITDRKKVEQALAESENHLRIILDNEPECVKLLNKKGEVLDMNPAGLAMIEADSLDSVKGKSVLNLVDEPFKGAFNELTKNVFSGEACKLEFKITGIKGGSRWLETHAVPLKDTNGKIISLLGVTRDITDRKRAREELKNSHESLRMLAAHLENVREEEKAALSRELHDELGQQLTAIKMDLSWVNKQVQRDLSLTDKIDDTVRLTNDAISTVRRINSDLRPSMLDDLGLFAALDYQINEFAKRFIIHCQFDIDMEEPSFGRSKEIAIFRMFQEALNNVAKHANAKNVRSTIRKVLNNMELVIVDDGIGFDRSQVGQLKSFGLLGMTERAMMMNGILEIHSAPGKGTTIQLSVPL